MTVPPFPPHLAGLWGSPYSGLAARQAAFRGETYPFHVGDTWMSPAVGCRVEDLHVADIAGLHAYTDTGGLPALRAALAERSAGRWGIPVTPAEVLVVAGGTAGLTALAGATLSPGDEVLILAPYWPLIASLVRTMHGVPVDVPFWVSAAGAPQVTDAAAAVAAVAQRCTARTRAIYLNSPHNPTGGVMPADWIAALVAFARDRGLWIWSDEVYEAYAWGGVHVPVRPLAPERTISVHSFSKAYGMAGLRAGWLVGPSEVIAQVGKIAINTVYHAPTPSMHAGLRALTHGAAWVADAAAQYADTGAACARLLGVPPPAGSTFLFLDVSDALARRAGADDGRSPGLAGLLEALADAGVLVAPGPSFGPYPHHIRLCFTAVDPDRTLRGVRTVAALLGR